MGIPGEPGANNAHLNAGLGGIADAEADKAGWEQQQKEEEAAARKKKPDAKQSKEK